MEQRFNRLSFGVRGTVDRVVFEDAELPNGAVADQSDRIYTQVGGILRVGYELSPGLRPFAELRADTRQYDRGRDNAGFARSSDGVGGRLGSTFEITRTITGEASFGYENRVFEDSRIEDLSGPVGEASLVWSVSPLTAIGLRASASLDDTSSFTSATQAGGVPNSLQGVDSGGNPAVRRQAATLEVTHAFMRDLTATAIGTFTRQDYEGSGIVEDGLIGTVRLDYKLNRSVSLRTSFTHERLISTLNGRDYTANVLLVGLRLQR